jgi:hypothetical protein
MPYVAQMHKLWREENSIVFFLNYQIHQLVGTTFPTWIRVGVLGVFVFCFVFSPVLGMECRVLLMLARLSTTELYSQPRLCFITVFKTFRLCCIR